MLNFTLPADERVRFELASGGFQSIKLWREVEGALRFRAVFSPHDNPNLVLDYPLRQQALDGRRRALRLWMPSPAMFLNADRSPSVDARVFYSPRLCRFSNAPHAAVVRTTRKTGQYIDPLHHRLAACPPLARWHLDALPPSDEGNSEGVPAEGGAKTFIYADLPAIDPCEHPHPRALAYIARGHGHGPSPHRAPIPQFSYSVTPLYADTRVAMPLNWVCDDLPQEDRPPPVGCRGRSARTRDFSGAGVIRGFGMRRMDAYRRIGSASRLLAPSWGARTL
ncbi:hypothetical protein B0H16DRAFT_333555 [Mycena metata]|uniref:Uncharacterized protein n=1 Tax=Mycena metata TaxID=1033252 RepID=A0AAD7HM23_9AGAR|nr:hypothetical protein B0H16DRAFT_333555 [Mycena metata]